MQIHLSSKWSWFIMIMVGALFVAPVIFFGAGGKAPQDLAVSEPIKSIQNIAFGEQVRSGRPIHLRIPQIKVDVPIEYVGITPQGAMGTPAGPINAAWFNLSPRPGEKGISIIDGHFGWKDNIPAVFNNLYKLHKGDKIYVEDEKGMTTTFVVRELRTYGQNENPPEMFVSIDGKAHLNLITCEGAWSAVQKSYSDRLVVFTDKE